MQMMGFQNLTLAICLVIITAKGLDAAIWRGRGGVRRKDCTSLFSFFFFIWPTLSHIHLLWLFYTVQRIEVIPPHMYNEGEC